MPKAKQPSRKGKAAWRKNIDLDEVEEKLERKRGAERVGVKQVDQGTQSSSIFVEDRSGDVGLASVRTPKPKKVLKSLEVLNNQTGPPGWTSRVKRATTTTSTGLTPEQRAIRAGMSKKDIEKLRRLAGKDVKGAFGIVVEEDEPKKRGVEAVIVPGTYDVWTDSADVKGKKRASGGATALETSWDEPLRHKDIQVSCFASAKALGWCANLSSLAFQLPASFVHAKKKVKSTSLDLPKPGQSYNPAAEDHEVLLNRAIEDLQKEEELRQKELEWKKSWDAGAKEARGKGVDEFEDFVGLKVARGDDAVLAEGEEGDSEDKSDVEDDKAVKEIKRKTKQQKAKAKKIKEEIRARLEAKANKRSMSELQSLRSFKRQLIATELEIKQMAEKRRLAREKKNQERVGVYKLPKRQEEVQLGEDLAEGLRTLKVGDEK